MSALVAASVVVVSLSACVPPSPEPAATEPASQQAAPDTERGRTTPTPTPRPSVPPVARQSAALEDHRRVAPPAPTRLEIPDLGIDVVVQPVGLDDQGRMALFDDPAVAAWYQWGPAPASDAGSTVIAAHVDSLEYDLLPFARLQNATPGVAVYVTDASGTRHGYAVQGVEVLEKTGVDWAAAFDRAGPPRLTLVTCGGEFDRVNRRYLSNLVLSAVPTG
jgi:sortase (surface protein transpeptidase)